MAMLAPHQVEAIHRATLHLLGRSGIELMSAPARDAMRAFGAEVDEAICVVRFGEEVLQRALA